MFATGVLPAANLKKTVAEKLKTYRTQARCLQECCPSEDLPVLTKELKKVIMIIAGK